MMEYPTINKTNLEEVDPASLADFSLVFELKSQKRMMTKILFLSFSLHLIVPPDLSTPAVRSQTVQAQ